VQPPPTPQSWKTAPPKALAGDKSWKLKLKTTCGDVVADALGRQGPQAVSSAIFLSRNGFWNGSPCHRLTTEGIYVLQCGDPTGTGTGGPGYTFGPVENAPKNGVYPAGTIAMARAQSTDSNGSQFFIVYKDSSLPAPGYTVLGRITSGPGRRPRRSPTAAPRAAATESPCGRSRSCRPASLPPRLVAGRCS
jgi:peptidyl-prolyl cis-trans isomerase B (cyclophilin B)